MNFLIRCKQMINERYSGYLIASGIIFLTLLIVSSLLAYFYPQNETFSDVRKDISKDITEMQRMSPFELFLNYLGSNTLVCLILAVFGFTFGIGTLYIIFTNALRLGVIIASIVPKYGFIWILASIPHCIFEIPAILLSCALGFRIAKCLFLMLVAVTNKRRIPPELLKDFKRTGKDGWVILPVCILLLVIAALIEAYITPAWFKFLIDL